MKKKFMGLLATAALLLAACSGGGDTTDSGSTSTSGDTAAVSQTISVSTAGELTTLDSGQYTDTYSSDMIGQLAEGLYRLDADGQPELAMAAEDPEISEDGLTYTFKIRDAEWSNGDPVTANDFEYAFKYVANPENASSSINQMDIFQNGYEVRNGDAEPDTLGVTALDDETLELTLASPISYLDQILVGTPFMPRNESFASDLGTAYGTSSDNFLGNGPFTISGWNGNSESWTLTKNENYWDADNVQLDQIDVQVITETATGVNLFDTGALDFTLLTDTYAQEEQDNALSHYDTRSLVGYVSANQNREVTGNVLVRQALLQSIDKEGYVENVLGDGSTALNGFVPANFAYDPDSGEDFREENGDLLPYDLDAAKEAWAAAKEELGQDEITLEILSADSTVARRTVEFLQGQWQDNLEGLTISVASMPLSNRLQRQTDGDFDLVFGTWTPDYADPINFLEFYDSTGGLNTSGYASESYDAGLQEARTTLANDPEARWDELLALEKQLIEEDTAVLPIYQGALAYLQSERLQGVQTFQFGRTVSYRLAYVTE
ncbi:peptide ABC transporter substrate-binding protein [Enterococcus sp. HY326]|uniref:peptide ABC transporter substrate-binding protein n=1 Tax=Enterococcus sp. HY326 TaxID=2971265 RepID=UPI00223F23AA|nr:peptide ABC transporter substrate-binding protein [Enterococcus sp. HY326]